MPTPLTDPTLGLLIEIADRVRTRPQLREMLLKSNLARFSDEDAYTKKEYITTPLSHARAAAEEGDEDAQNGLLTFARLLAQVVAPTQGRTDHANRFARIREQMLGEGYDLRLASTQDQPDQVRLVSTDPSNAPLASEVTALEADLTALGLTTALGHYLQANDNFVRNQYESSNGQLRAMLENVVAHFARQHGFSDGGRAGVGGQAIQYLIDQQVLPERDGGTFLRGLWQITHTNGPHPGRSTADEARFRMQVVTAAARFLIDLLGPAPASP